MKKASWHERGSSTIVACCALAFACSGTPDQEPSPLEQPGSAGGGASGSSSFPQGGMSVGPGTAGSDHGAGSPAAVTAGSGNAIAGAGGTADVGPIALDPPPFQAAPGMLRRLTRTQFRNAVRDIFGSDVDVDVSRLDGDNWTGNFAVIGAASVVTSQRGVEQYHAVIEAAVDAVFAEERKRAAFMGCTPASATGDACTLRFIERVGRRAWRRPLEAAEIARLVAIAETAATELGEPTQGARWATVALFTSPNFLYRPELGAPAADGTLRFTEFEVASRLAFLVWNSLPDEMLLDQAASGLLGTAEGRRAAATRLLEAPAGREAVGAFAEEYMRLDRIASQAKDAGLYPEYDAALQAAMIRDMREVWEIVALDDRAGALSLFTTPKVVVNTELARLYGLDTTGLTSTTFAVRSLPVDSPRTGILGKAAFLSQFGNQKEGSPTLRGKFMRDALLCTPIPPPPGDVDVVLDEPPADMPMTKRQRLEMHRTSPACAGCHSQMDPLGLPFETFDAIGRYRTTERGLPIDPSGEFNGVPVSGARELGESISSSLSVARCLLRKYYSYAAGHEERAVDGSVLNALDTSFQASGFQLRELILDIVTHEAFSSVARQP